ncbi:unnamed protein product [Notodromas monacha]|uniref:Bridge-like lipid transfer protein family member 1 C-terminal domain-containing protein n=1 Tax=Notodromas monacha TaxID=399045 RepID=A0A7R9BFD0_9CRUS|nr:unnamed protein product [Notodromas monacha]CAG0914383.1 unnamed protein product [Notodromas monacha]
MTMDSSGTASWNMTGDTLKDLTTNSQFPLLLVAILLAIFWCTYIAFYNSRVIGSILTYGLKRFFGSGAELVIGSISLSILSGKLIFRNVVYITPDFTVRVQDGGFKFRWWKPYKPKAINEDMSREDCRLFIEINGLELHIYNRSVLYGRLESLFGLEPMLIPSPKIGMWKSLWRRLTIWERRNQSLLRDKMDTPQSDRESDNVQDSTSHELSAFSWTRWRDFFPVVKIDLHSSRFVFGNHLLPTALSFCVDEAKCVYTSRPAQSPYDLYMHSVKANIETFKMMFSPSPKYVGEIDEPPRYMGEGFLIFSSNSVEAYYYQDEPNFSMSSRNDSIASHEEIPLNSDSSSPPVWGLDLKCGKNTDISYGTWAERQRDLWMKFFFPWDYEQMQPTKEGYNYSAHFKRPPQKSNSRDTDSEAAATSVTLPGSMKRQPHTFDLKISLLEQSSIDILFSKQSETQAVHMRVYPGSYLDITIPLLVDCTGYTTVINGQFLILETTTGLAYRSLLNCETLEYTVKIHHPLEWNDHQDCTLDVTVCKGTAHFTYVHKTFIQEMIDDWSSKSRPDILSFIPYTWTVSIGLKQFEVVLPVNQYNWLDCTSKQGENDELCVCGDVLDVSIVLPFSDYLPETVPVNVSIHGEVLILGMRVPPAYTSHAVLMALQKDAKILRRDGRTAVVPEDERHRWRNVCTVEDGWIDCVWVPMAGCKIEFVYHPMPPIESLRSVENYHWGLGSRASPGLNLRKKRNQSGKKAQTTPEQEEEILLPIRAPSTKRILWEFDSKDTEASKSFRPEMLPPDRIHVLLEFGATTFYLYGTVFRLLWFFKDDFLGEYQTFHDMETGWEEFLSHGDEPPTPEDSPNLFRKRLGHFSAESRKRTDAKPADSSSGNSADLSSDFDPRHYRPLKVTVSFIMHDIQGTLMSHSCPSDDSTFCPVLSMEQLVVEVHKSFHETKLQVNCSPISLKVWDSNQRTSSHEHLSSGNALLTSFQFRGHAMFSDEDRKLGDETIEYAWLTEVQFGHLMCRLTLPQVYQIVTSLNTFALLILDAGNGLKQPPRPVYCLHGVLRDDCPDRMICSTPGDPSPDGTSAIEAHCLEKTVISLCPTSEDIKYCMVRVIFDSIDLVFVEEATALQLEVYPVRMATCNAHGETVRSGLSLLVENIAIHQYMAPLTRKKAARIERMTCEQGTNPGAESHADSSAVWLEVGSLVFGPLQLDAALSPHTSSFSGKDLRALQQGFLKKYDDRSKRLWFLWVNDSEPSTSKQSDCLGRCGCVGGCAFFGKNLNGKTFFKPSAQDFQDGYNVAQYRVFRSPEENIYGFGQSLLNPSRLVFEPSRIVASGDDCRHECNDDSNADGPHSSSSSTSTVFSQYGELAGVCEAGLGHSLSGVSVTGSHGAEESCFNQAKFSPTDVRRSVTHGRTAASSKSFHRQVSAGSEVKVKAETIGEEGEMKDAEDEDPRLNGKKIYGQIPSASSIGSSDSYFSVREEPSQASKIRRGFGSGRSSFKDSSSGTPVEYRTASESSFKDPVSSASDRYFSDEEPTISGKALSVDDIALASPRETGMQYLGTDRASEVAQGTGKFSVHSLAASRTNSSTSFLSANSTLYNYDDDYGNNEFPDQSFVNLVDLHAQVKKHVSESPLLMSGYMSHLVQVKGKRWKSCLPTQMGGSDHVFLISSLQEGHLPPRSQYFPEFLPMSMGFTGIRIVQLPTAKKISTCAVAPSARDNFRQSNSFPFPPVTKEESVSSGSVTPTHLHSHQFRDFDRRSEWDCDFFAWRDQASKKSHGKQRTDAKNSDTDSDAHTDVEGANDDDWSPTWRPGVESDSHAIFDETVTGRTTLVFKVKSPLDLYFTPLAVESLQRFTDSLTDTLRNAHAMVIVDLMELLCSSEVEKRHVLLQEEKINLWAEAQSSAAFQAAKKINRSSKHNLKMRAGSTVSAVLAVGGGVGSAVLSGGDVRSRRKDMGGNGRGMLTVMEETRGSELQALVVIPKINIAVLQTSLVEYVTTTAGLDHFQDLLCVSVLALSMDKLRFEFYQRQEDKLTLQAIPSSQGAAPSTSALPGDKFSNFPWFRTKQKVGSLDKRGYFEPLMVENIAKSREEALAIFSLSRIHTQLRRLTNDSSLLEEAAVSAVDPSKSKVMFTFSVDPLYQLQVSQLRRQLMRRKARILPHSQFENGRDVDDMMGFIMCEAGLDNIQARLVFQRREICESDVNKKQKIKEKKFDGVKTTVVDEVCPSGGYNAGSLGRGVGTRSVAKDIDKGSETDGTETLKPCIEIDGTGYSRAGEKDRRRRGRKHVSSSAKPNQKMPPSTGDTIKRRKRQKSGSGPRRSTTCAVDFESVWFNFAAPPTSGGISKKVDFSKLDWNFLSTASPAISAWQGPIDRFVIVWSDSVLAWQLRRNSVVACLMTGAIDPVYLRMPAKSKHGLLSLISRKIQEDPGCQICTILRKYFLEMQESETKKLAESLDPKFLPRLDTLKKGIVALTKQLKHGLYVPMVLENNFRNKARSRVNFVQKAEVVGVNKPLSNEMDSISGFPSGVPFSPGDKSLDSLGGADDLTDDNTRLLSGDASWRKVASEKQSTPLDSTAKEIEGSAMMRDESTHFSPRFSRGTVTGGQYGRLSIGSQSLVDTSSIKSLEGGSQQVSRDENAPRGSSGVEDVLKNPDKFYWKFAQEQQVNQVPATPVSPVLDQSGGWNTLTSNQSTNCHSEDEDSPLAAMMPAGAIAAVDVHSVFKFFLSCLGIAPQQIGADVTERAIAGPCSVVSVSCKVEQIRVHIAEPGSSFLSAGLSGDHNTRVNFSIDMADELPAFVCEGLSLQVDGEKIQNSLGQAAKQGKGPRGVLYLSRRQLKNSTSNVANLQIDIKGINQKVNLPLLRLVQHIANMCQNAALLQKDLKEAREKSVPHRLGHQKNSSSESGFLHLHLDLEAEAGGKESQAKETSGVPFGDTIDSTIVSAWREEVEHVDSASFGAASATSLPGKLKVGISKPCSGKDKGYEKLGDVVECCDSPKTVRINAQKGEWVEPIPNIPECWKSLYHLINLYAITPETKTVSATKAVLEAPVRSSFIQDTAQGDVEVGNADASSIDVPQVNTKASKKHGHRRTGSRSRFLRSVHVTGDKEPEVTKVPPSTDVRDGGLKDHMGTTHSTVITSAPAEKVRMLISGVININRIGLTATLSGLKLEGEIRGLSGYFAHRRAADQSPAAGKRTAETAGFFSDQLASKWTPSALGPSYVHHFSTMTIANASVKKTSIVLLEGVPPKMMQVTSQSTIVRLDVGRVDSMYSNKNESRGWKHSRKSRLTSGPTVALQTPIEKNVSELVVASIEIDIPQHPVVLHSMMARSSKHLTQLTNTLQELRVKRTTSRLSRGTTQDDFEQSSSGTAHFFQLPDAGGGSSGGGAPSGQDALDHVLASHSGVHEILDATRRETSRAPGFLQPSFVVNFSISLGTLRIQASLLPSLQAQYVMDQVKSSGVSGPKAKFSVELSKHCLSFSTKLQDPESTIPPSASIALPRVEVLARYIQDDDQINPLERSFGDGMLLCKGNYLNAEVRIGALVHNLTTDVLNHLVFVQKVFMKEVNEVLQKMTSGNAYNANNGEKKRNVRLKHSKDPLSKGTQPSSGVNAFSDDTSLLYLFAVKFDGIQVTATTPTSSAVRFQTGKIEVQISNRVENTGSVRLFYHAQVHVNVALGQLIGLPASNISEADFQQFAFFKTQIVLRNAFQEELGPESWQDVVGKDVILISMDKPRIFILPVAVDRAIMVWLNYRNAYEYWTEQRATLKREVLLATQQFMERVPNLASLAGQQASYLFLKLTVRDIGICLPLSSAGQRSGTTQPGSSALPGTSTQIGAGGRSLDLSSGAAVMISLESTSISACSYGAMVSNGAFESLCMRFEDEFDISEPEWKPNWNDPGLMNVCVVNSGTYQVCSRTTSAESWGNPKWVLNVSWQMDGVDIHLDTDVGKQLSALAYTLTSLTEVADEDGSMGLPMEDLNGDALGPANMPQSTSDDPKLDERERSRLSESQMAAMVKKVNDLREAGVRRAVIDAELQKIRELEKFMSSEVRKGWMKKLRRQSVRAPSIRDNRPLPPASPVKSSKSFTSPGSSPYADWDRHFTLPASDSEYDDSDYEFERSPSEDVFDGNSSVKKRHGMDEKFEERTRIKSERSNRDKSRKSRPRLLYPPSDEPTNSSKEKKYFGYSINRQSGLPASASGGGVMSEPLLDFELDVTVLISSGSCVLHSKEHVFASDDAKHRHGKFIASRRDTAGADAKLGIASPSGRRKPRDNSSSGLGSRLRPGNIGGLSLSTLTPVNVGNASAAASGTAARNTTTILVPGLDVKVHYESKTEWEEGTRKEEDGAGIGPANKSAFMMKGPKARQDSKQTSSLSSTSTSNDRLKVSHSLDSHGSSHSLSRAKNRSAIVPGAQYSQSSGGKKGRIFAALNIHSVPEEIVLSPHILDFLEQALEPIPMPATNIEEPYAVGLLPSPNHQVPNVKIIADDDEMPNEDDADAPGNSGIYFVGSSFPVDTTVSFHMKPSVFRFICEPVSKVECLLKLPSLDLIVSKKPEDDLLHKEFGDFIPASNANIGGYSVTGCLADFSLYIFHPYGKKIQADSSMNSSQTPSVAASSQDRKDSLSLQVEFVKFNLSRSRKLNKPGGLEHIPSRGSFSLSHSPGTDGNPNFRSLPGQQLSREPQAVVRCSTIVDIGSATFKYDMKRLAEILGFPKAWYRRSIVRRLFLGDVMVRQGSGSGISSTSSVGNAEARSPKDFDVSEDSRKIGSKGRDEGLAFVFPSGRRGTAKGVSLFLPLSPEKATADHTRRRESGDGSVHRSANSSSTAPTWETLVLFAVNFQKLSVQMNMSNVMGNVLWLTQGFLADGRLSIGSSGHKEIHIGVGLENSNLDAKGGIVGGNVDLSCINTFLRIKADPGMCPNHIIGVNLLAVEATVENVGSSVLMGRVSSLQVTLRDQWAVTPSPYSTLTTSQVTPPPLNPSMNERPSSIHLCGMLEWDQFQLMITQSTTAELLKMYYKLREFISQQLHSGRIVISSLQHDSNRREHMASSSPHPSSFGRKFSSTPGKQMPMKRESVARAPGDVSDNREEDPLNQHRHWQKALTYVRRAFGIPSLDGGANVAQPMVLGGSLQMHGSTISLACFHGLNFRSQSWALFSLKQPFIAFNTEAQDLIENPSTHAGAIVEHGTEQCGTHVVQQLTFSLGERRVVWKSGSQTGESMATVCRISRSMTFPPKCRTIHDWFHYAFATGLLDNVDRFPNPSETSVPPDSHEGKKRKSDTCRLRQGVNVMESAAKQEGASVKPSTSTDYHQSSEIIFALPGMQLDMTTEHVQRLPTPQDGETKPLVNCKFITAFDDHIFVPVDAQGFFFLHDLIRSYVQESDQTTTGAGDDKAQSTGSAQRSSGANVGSEQRRVNRQQSIDPMEILQKDAREFICKHWQMEPTVRFISWGGKQIEPYGVDYILQKLGFRHARITIPKWLQRGCLDPLDKLLSVFILNLLTIHVKPEPSLLPLLSAVLEQKDEGDD